MTVELVFGKKPVFQKYIKIYKTLSNSKQMVQNLEGNFISQSPFILAFLTNSLCNNRGLTVKIPHKLPESRV